MEEQMWQQQSHSHWMVLGDSNTKYFHNRAFQRFRRNTISKLQDLNGMLVLGKENVSSIVVDYYK